MSNEQRAFIGEKNASVDDIVRGSGFTAAIDVTPHQQIHETIQRLGSVLIQLDSLIGMIDTAPNKESCEPLRGFEPSLREVLNDSPAHIQSFIAQAELKISTIQQLLFQG